MPKVDGMTIIKATFFEDEGFYRFNLPYGSYLINGNPVAASNQQEITCKDKPVVTKITRCSIRTHWEDKDGNQLSIEEYVKQLTQLHSKGEWDEYGESYKFEDIEDSFALQRFEARWKPISREVQTESDPIPVEVRNSVLDTGNKYIKNVYTAGGSDPHLFVYYRAAALRAIATKVMTELGMVFETGIDYSRTKNKKVWGCQHEGIRFLVAFGTYVFSNDWESKHNPRSTLAGTKGMYEADVKNVTRIIKAKYAQHFNCAANLDLENLLNNLRDINRLALKVDSKAKTHTEHFSLKTKIRETITQVENQLAEQTEEN